MAKLTAPISIGKVASALGSTSGDLGTLCSYHGINKDALHVPLGVGLEDIDKPIDKDYKPTFGDGFASVGFGIGVPCFTGKLDEILGNFGQASSPLWKRNQKTPTDRKYACLAHFDGYDHTAESLLSPIQIVECEKDKMLRIKLNTSAGSGECMGFGNIPMFKRGAYVMGVAVFENGQRVAVATTYPPIGEASNKQIRLNTIKDGCIYHIVPFVTSQLLDVLKPLDSLDQSSPTYPLGSDGTITKPILQFSDAGSRDPEAPKPNTADKTEGQAVFHSCNIKRDPTTNESATIVKDFMPKNSVGVIYWQVGTTRTIKGIVRNNTNEAISGTFMFGTRLKQESSGGMQEIGGSTGGLSQEPTRETTTSLDTIPAGGSAEFSFSLEDTYAGYLCKPLRYNPSYLFYPPNLTLKK